MIRGTNAIRVIVLAALVIAVAFSSTVASRFAGTPTTVASVRAKAQATKQQKMDSAWQAQLANQQNQLQQAQQQQASASAASAANNAQSVLTPPTPTPTPTPTATATPAPTQAATPAPASSGSSSAPAEPAGSIQAIIEAAFSPQGSAAVSWGLCIASHESGDNPNAENPSGASGLFQFMPSTFAKTPPGEAGGSIWDPTANAQAAAWMYSQGRQGEWSTNGMC